jgi:hypothetical protein
MIGQSLAFRDAAMIGRKDWLDLGVGNATIEVYGNTRPVVEGGAAGASPLFTFTLTKPCGTITNAVLSVTASAFALVAASGDPTWARWKNGNGDFAMDTGAGGPLSGEEVEVSAGTVYAGGKVVLASASLA